VSALLNHSVPLKTDHGRTLLWARGEEDTDDVEWFDMTDSTIDGVVLHFSRVGAHALGQGHQVGDADRAVAVHVAEQDRRRVRIKSAS